MSNRILIIRLSAVGDTILTLPILCALRRHRPESQLGWVVSRGAGALLQGHECLDRLFVLPPEASKSLNAFWQFMTCVREWAPDVVIETQGLTKSASIGWFSGAPRRIGLAKAEFEGRELSRWLNNEIVAPRSKHVVDRGLELLRPLGIEDPAVEYRIPRFDTAAVVVEKGIAELDFKERWGILNVGAGWISKVWPSQRYADVAVHLAERWGLRSLVVWGDERERRAAEQVVALAQGAAILAPSTSLPELSEWIRRAHLFVGSDTGPMHLAVALNTPTIGMIGPMPVDRVGPRGPFHLAVQKDRLPDYQRKHRKVLCGPMLSIDSQTVCSACDRVLDQCSRCKGQAA